MNRSEVPPEFRPQPAPITDRQLSYLLALLDGKDIPADLVKTPGLSVNEAITRMRRLAPTLTKEQASRSIEKLSPLPWKPKGAQIAYDATRAPSRNVPSPEEVPAGRYAVENEDGELRFYKLWRGDRNPDYIKLYVQHGPDESEVPFKGALGVLAKIKEDPRGAALAYGIHIGACSICGKRLTNALSRALSIGPVCGGRFWDEGEWTTRKAEASHLLKSHGIDPKADLEGELPSEVAEQLR